jgi:hypothetical protein
MYVKLKRCIVSKLSAKGAYPYRKRACLEALKLATAKLTQRGTGYPPWDTLLKSESPEETQAWLIDSLKIHKYKL